jgi:hypothetical protein
MGIKETAYAIFNVFYFKQGGVIMGLTPTKPGKFPPVRIKGNEKPPDKEKPGEKKPPPE